MINLFLVSVFSSFSWGQCEYKAAQVPMSNTFEPSYIPSLIQHSKGCTTLVELWASWCGPCRMISPQIDELVKEYPNLVLHQISADEKIPAMKKFVAQNPLHSPPYRLSSWTLDALSTSFAQVGGEFESAIPYFVLISPEGKVVLELTEPKNLDSIKTYLSKNPPPKKKEIIQKK
jgi:thiol-disulfide isomerase/thioredoxin